MANLARTRAGVTHVFRSRLLCLIACALPVFGCKRAGTASDSDGPAASAGLQAPASSAGQHGSPNTPKGDTIDPDNGKVVTPPSSAAGPAQPTAEMDAFPTQLGPMRVIPIDHATMRFEVNGKNIYTDPYKLEQVSNLPKADLVLITHAHPDHYDPSSLAKVTGPNTQVVVPAVVAEKQKSPHTQVMKNGETKNILGLSVEAVPMYNLKRGPKPGTLFHDKGVGNGYLLGVGGQRVYIAGDTECTDEMKNLKNIDIAFVPMNLPYTMPPEEAAECVKAFRPKVVYPYHYRDSDLSVFQKALAQTPGVEVRLRNWYPAGS